MASLTEYRKLANDAVKAGVIDEIITADFLLAMLQFKGHSGHSFVYNRELTLPQAQPHAVGDTYEDSNLTLTRKTATLQEVGIQSSLDGYIIQTVNNVQQPEGVLRAKMAKGLSREIARQVIKGEPENNAQEIEGLDSICRAETRMMAMDDGNVDGPGKAETEVTLDRLDAMIDQVDDGKTKPDALVMNTTMRRKLTALSRVTGSGVLMSLIEMFGHKISVYDGIPIIINNWITDAEEYNDSGTWPSSSATTIFGVKLGEEKDGYTILHNGPVLDPAFIEIGWLEKKNQRRYRMVAYLQSVVFSTKQIIALGGIDSAA